MHHIITVTKGISIAWDKDGNNIKDSESSTADISSTAIGIAAPRLRSKYNTARSIAGFISFLGWLVVVVMGILWIYLTVKSSGNFRYMNFQSILLILVSPLSGIIAGLFMVATGQIMRAIVDIGDNTRNTKVLLEDLTEKLAKKAD